MFQSFFSLFLNYWTESISLSYKHSDQTSFVSLTTAIFLWFISQVCCIMIEQSLRFIICGLYVRDRLLSHTHRSEETQSAHHNISSSFLFCKSILFAPPTLPLLWIFDKNRQLLRYAKTATFIVCLDIMHIFTSRCKLGREKKMLISFLLLLLLLISLFFFFCNSGDPNKVA